MLKFIYKELSMKKILKTLATFTVAAALAFNFSACSSDDSSNDDGGSGNPSTSLPKTVGKDTFSGMTVQYEGTKKITFKDGVATFTNGSKTEKTCNYSIDSEKKLIHFAFKSIIENDYKEKTYTNISSYVTRNNSSMEKYGGYSKAAIKAINAAETIFYSQIVSFTYEITDKEIKVAPYYNGPVTALTGLNKMGVARRFSGNSYTGIESTHPGFGAIQVTFYKGKELIGFVTQATKNTLECTYLSAGDGSYDVGGKFTVEVTVTPESGNDAKAKMKLTAIDEALTVATGLEAGAESEELKFSGWDSDTWTITESTTEAEKEETKTETTTKTDTSASSSGWKFIYDGKTVYELPAEYSDYFDPEKDLKDLDLKAGTDYTIDKSKKTITIKNANAAKALDEFSEKM